MVERTPDFFPPSQKVACFSDFYTHPVQLRLEVRILQCLKIEKSGLIEVPLARTLLQSIGYLLSDLLVLLDHVIHVDILGLVIANLRNGKTLPVDKQIGEVGAEIFACLGG